jgi:hypothetical protein
MRVTTMAKRANPALLIGLVAAGVLLMGAGGESAKDRKAGLSESDQRAYDKLKQLAETTGDDQYHPDKHPLEDVIRGFQVSVGLERADGVFDDATESALEEVLVGLIPK